MGQEIRRAKTSDPEMDAIVVIAQALAPLERSAAKRVLDWANKRFVDPEVLPDMDKLVGLTKWMEAVQTTALTLEDVSTRELVVAMGRVAQDVLTHPEPVDAVA